MTAIPTIQALQTKGPMELPDVPFSGVTLFIEYKNAIAPISLGRWFKVSEKHIDLFWFLFYQIGDEYSLIIDSASYEASWMGNRGE